jgi:hypothetical protein
MNGYNPTYDTNGKEVPSGGGAPAIAVGEPNPGEPIPVEPNGGPGGDGGPLYGGNPLSHLSEDLSSWFPRGNDPGGDKPPFCGTPHGSGDGPYIIPGYGEAPSGPNDPLDCW